MAQEAFFETLSLSKVVLLSKITKECIYFHYRRSNRIEVQYFCDLHKNGSPVISQFG